MASEAAFTDENGMLNHYAQREHQRVCAGLNYLYYWRKLGHEAAAVKVCTRFGHDVRGGRCERCGVGAVEMRMR